MRRDLASLVLRLALAMVIGLTATVGLAWAAAIVHANTLTTGALAIIEPGRGGWTAERIGATHVQVLDEDFMIQSAADAADISQAPVLSPALAVAECSRREQGVPALKAEHVHAFGWPLRCLWYHARGTEDLTSVELAPSDPAINLNQLDTSTDEFNPAAMTRERPVLPLRPLWLGLTFDVLVFGTAAFTLLSIPAMIRAGRRRHHCCEYCGYTLLGLHSRRCPECGHPIVPFAIPA